VAVSVGRSSSLERRGAPLAAVARPTDLAQIYRDHAADVSRWAQRLLGPGGDVDDVLHEVFLVAHRRLGEFRGEARITTWLYAITVRVVQDRRRKERVRRWFRLSRRHEDASAPSTPLQVLEGRRAAELTYKILDTLPEADRSALILFELEGLTGEQIAAITGDALGTIWVRLHRARSRFRKAFEKAESAAERAPAADEEVTP
jgi:RNA polymerase sigma-70 factor (ECF subfamily)